MKTQKAKKSKVIRIFIAIAAVLLLVPFPVGYKDGGTVKYRAVLYCVTKQHSIAFGPLEQEDGYDIGTAVEILGFEVYNDVEYYSIQTLIELNK
ncbi:MAG: hypothetical protein OSJ54_02160 [Oscillospiraceae bacterium]|nr:hypothetical protein [Oscillospiraceae bacterium]